MIHNSKKLLFLNLYSGKIERGAESFTHELIQKLSATHQVKLIHGDSKLMPSSTFQGNFIRRILKRLFLNKPARHVFWFTLTNLSKIIQAKPDVIFPLNGFWQLLLLKFIQPFLKFKIIITGHSGPGWDERWNLYLHPNYFVATTGPTLQWAQKTCPWTKSILIPYAIDPSVFSPKKTTHKKPHTSHLTPQTLTWLHSTSKPLILCPSALVAYKRIYLAIKAVAQTKQGSLLVLGKGPLKTKLTKLGQKLLGKRFLLTSVPHSYMPFVYQQSDIVTLPSHPQENSPMIFLEALASGKPLVATDSSRNRWMLEDAATFVDPTDTKSYTKALESIKITRKAQTIAISKFLWPQVLSAYEKLIQA